MNIRILHGKILCGTMSVALAILLFSPQRLPAGETENRQISSLAVYPANVALQTKRDFQSLIVQATTASGLTIDVTDQAEIALANAEIVRQEKNKLYPLADGETTVTVSYGGQTLEIPITVSQAAAVPPISFKTHVMPVFMKAGCNQGSCHGAARGKDGFMLSLFGYDPNGDYHRLTRELSGRRVNLAKPTDSLLMQKATGAVQHTGGKRIEPNDEYYATFLEWLKNGAVNDPGPVPTVVSLELYPPGGVLNGPDTEQQMTVRAMYSDGTDRDVTSLAYFLTSNENSAKISQTGKVTAANRGEAFVMARFDTHTVGVPFVVLPPDLEFTWPEVAESNYVDSLIHQKLKRLRVIPSDISSDAEFARRVNLDICGRVPAVEEITTFVADADPEKRRKLIDALLERKEFVEMWVMKWSELLQIRSTQQVSYKATLLYYNWLQEQVSNNVPIDEMVRQLLGAEGGTFNSPATNYYQTEQNTLKISENVAQVFMGMRVQCAQCHNHPFDRWTMDDYYGFAAFFSQIGRKRGEDPREQVVFNRGGGDMKHPVGGRVMAPKFLGGETPDTQGKDRRKIMGEWLASAENPFFSKNLANIVWAHFFGKGIVDEVDDVRASNPPVNAELLDELANKFVEYKFDFKKMVRDICNSRTYQLSTQTNDTNESDNTNFSHAMLRRIRAEVLLDVISQITETKNKFRGLPLGARAVQIADGNTSTYFLTTFGRATRASVCSCEVKMEPNLSQALHLINGESVHAKVQQGGVIKRLVDEGKTDREVFDFLYLRCLSRPPTEQEWEQTQALLADGDQRIAALEDTFWALLNSREFVFNH